MSEVSAYLNQLVQSAAAPSNEQLDAALANLADISLGATPSIWPLAWGWWVLAALVLALVTGLVWFIVKYIRKHRYKRHALKAITAMQDDEANTSENLAKLHAILRSAIIHYFPNETINGLQGAAWQHFLQGQAHDAGKADQRYLSDLVQLEASLYTKGPSITMTDAKQAVSSWIGNCLPPSPSSTQKKGVQHV